MWVFVSAYNFIEKKWLIISLCFSWRQLTRRKTERKIWKKITFGTLNRTSSQGVGFCIKAILRKGFNLIQQNFLELLHLSFKYPVWCLIDNNLIFFGMRWQTSAVYCSTENKCTPHKSRKSHETTAARNRAISTKITSDNREIYYCLVGPKQNYVCIRDDFKLAGIRFFISFCSPGI